MLREPGFLTVRGPAECEIIEKKSRFIGRVWPVCHETEALEHISAVRAQCWDARHNAFAYILHEGNICRHSDDGEPHGTAGVPVLDVMHKRGLQNVICVVTRYFGGVLLGTGGLVRAYSRAAAGALDLAGIAEMSLCCECRLMCDYGLYGKVSGLIAECGGVVDDVEFAQEITLRFHVKKDGLPQMQRRLEEGSSGMVRCVELNEGFYAQ